MNVSLLERYRSIVDDWGSFTASLAEDLPTCIVTNTLRIGRDELRQRLDRRQVRTRLVPWADDAMVLEKRGHPGVRYEYLTGLYNVQEEAAVIPVKLLDAQPGERILDLCSAPGNKTAQIAMAMQNRGTVVANDRSAGRHRATRSILDRLGLGNVCMSLHNGTNFPRSAGTFDRVLVDVPCSCEGTSRKLPAVLDQQQQYDKLAGVQRGLLQRAFELCEPGGRVVYSTCTYAPEENEEVIDDVLSGLDFDVEWLDCRLEGFASAPGLTSWRGRSFDPRMARAMRVWPHLNDTGGFFVAAWDKSPDAQTRVERPPMPAALASIDPDPWLQPLNELFGWGDFEGWSLFAPNKKSICIRSDDFQPPPGVRASKPAVHVQFAGAGLDFLRSAMAVPKPTTVAAIQFGAMADRGVIDLTQEQMDAFFRREDVKVSRADGGMGYVLVRCEDVVAGLGRHRGDSGMIESLYPKAWTLGQGVSAFEDET